jgi:hypothetical protein
VVQVAVENLSALSSVHARTIGGRRGVLEPRFVPLSGG